MSENGTQAELLLKSQTIHQSLSGKPRPYLTLFNLVIDPLLVLLREKSLCLSVNGLFLGGFAHADDIRTLASSIDESIQQTDTVRSFTASRGLQLN